MADSKAVTVVPLNGTNYPTWKIQCRMALMKEGLWKIVTSDEPAPDGTDEAVTAKFVARRDRALATVVLSIDPSLLYLLGDPQDPVVVWKKLAGQFEKKTWATRLDLRRKLHSLRLKDGESAQEHIRVLTELFDALSVAGETVSEDDRVVYLLASLPESYGVLVTALEANETVPKLEVVTERILHQERKFKEKSEASAGTESAMPARKSYRRSSIRCYHCREIGHIKRHCKVLEAEKESQRRLKDSKFQKASLTRTRESSDSEGSGLIACHALSASNSEKQFTWILDSGATCHMCQDSRAFTTSFHKLEEPIEVVLGDGRALMAVGRGEVVLDCLLPNGESKLCTLHDVLYVPKLAYNLLSVAKASQRNKIVKFTKSACYVLNKNHKLIAKATKVGSLYQLDHKPYKFEQATVAEKAEKGEDIWHRRFGHLGVASLQKIARDKLVTGFDFDANSKLVFCEACPQGKQHRNKFSTNARRAKEPLKLVHSDLCGKMGEKSLSGAEYFLSFIDDSTRYVWVYFLKSKDEVFSKFVEWKAMVETSTGRKLKILHSDNGGEYTSNEFKAHVTAEGVRHELTIPKTPQQNGVAECMNRTLVEMARSMLIGANMPQTFWAEAISTAAYLRNRSPTKSIQGITPYEAWTGDKPCVDGLRIFGCQAFVHIPKDERKKLESKSRKCILLGYGRATKGYRLYDPQKKVFFSRDVIFNEGRCGLKELFQTRSEPQLPVYLECSDESSGTIELPVPEIPETAEGPVPTSQQSESTETEEPRVPAVRRSERTRKQTDFYGVWCNVSDVREPKSVDDALTNQHWLDAMKAEYNSFIDNEVWELKELPEGREAVGSKWVFKVKKNADGSFERCKARLVAQGYSQKEGLDYDETFSPVVRPESIRSVIALAVQHRLMLHQMDITTAFLNGSLDQVVYMRQPKGFLVQGQEHLVCRLKKSLYGLKQSPRCWNQMLDAQLKLMGFKQSKSDPCIYVSESEGMFVIAVYVDDILLAGKSEQKIAEIKSTLKQCFKLKDMGKLSYFLGVNVQQHSGKTWIGQPAYTQDLIKRFGMEQCNPANTLVTPGTKLVKSTEETEMFNTALYQSAVGSLLYLSGWTRPDIAFAVNHVARFCSCPTKEHWTAVKRILRYLKGTSNFGLAYSSDTVCPLVGYADADWAGDINDRRSTSGYLFMMSGAAVSWKSQKQTCTALSTSEAEYVALAGAAQEATWIRQLLEDLCECQCEPTVVYEDNQSAIHIAQNPQYHSKTKHIDIKFHYVREKVQDDTVKLQYCPTTRMIADFMTKGLAYEKFSRLRTMAGVVKQSTVK